MILLQEIKHISVGKDYNKCPFGRYRKDCSEGSAEAFRDDLLVPALHSHSLVVVSLEDVMKGYEYTSPWLHEVFGGLVLKHPFSAEQLEMSLVIEYHDKEVVAQCWEYINNPY